MDKSDRKALSKINEFLDAIPEAERLRIIMLCKELARKNEPTESLLIRKKKGSRGPSTDDKKRTTINAIGKMAGKQ